MNLNKKLEILTGYWSDVMAFGEPSCCPAHAIVVLLMMCNGYAYLDKQRETLVKLNYESYFEIKSLREQNHPA
jgi:hypothetical protein